MPKYGIHEIVLSKAISALGTSGSTFAGQAASDISAHRELAMMGAVGPDIFFWAPDYELVKKLSRLYRNIEQVVDTYEDVTRPINDIKDAVGEVTEKVVGDLAPASVDLIRSAVEEIKETAQIFKSTVSTGIFAGVLNISDFIAEAGSLPGLTSELFNMFAPPLQRQMENQQAHNEKEWYWFDMLHYRRTGRFASELVKNAHNGSSRQRAYSYGYLSHIATDVIGHPYVNQIVGAPYRLNVQRHAAVENYMDAWAYDQHYEGASVSKTLLSRLSLPDPEQVPDEIVSLINTAFRNAYSDLFPTLLGDPGFLSENQIRNTYTDFHTILTMMEKMIVERPEEPFSNVAEILSAALEDLLEPPPIAPSPSDDLSACDWDQILSANDSSRECFEEFFEQMEDYANYIGELLLWTFETMMDMLDLILATLLSMPINVLLALLYGMQLMLFEFYQTVRLVLAEYGFVYPEPDDLNSSTAVALTTTFLGCSPLFKYPNLRDNMASHLVCPASAVEDSTTAADFNIVSRDVNPNSFIENVSFDPENLVSYADADTPSATRGLEYRHKRIGNAVEFAEWMITIAANDDPADGDERILYTDWNLDSDRGYGYKTWNGRLGTTGGGIIDEGYVD